MWWSDLLTVGLPQTNYRGLAEPRLLMEACHLYWQALGEAIRRPIAALRNTSGDPVYATIVFIDEQFPPDRPLSMFALDDRLRFLVGLRAIKDLAVEARIVFDREDCLPEGDPAWDAQPPAHPRIRFGSILATPGAGNQLKLAQPANADCRSLPPLPPEESPLQITRAASVSGRLDIIAPGWTEAGRSIESTYAIDPDRDTNAAGLVYFATYVAVIESAERSAVTALGCPAHQRQLLRRRMAYFGNAGLSEHVAIAVSSFRAGDQPDRIGLRCRVTRLSDGKLICLSEALLMCAGAPA